MNHPPPAKTVRVCDSLTCEMFGAKTLLQQLEAEDIDDVRIQAVPCVGRCNAAPVAVVGTNPIETADTTKVKSAIENNAFEDTEPNCISFVEYKKNGGYQLLADCVDGKFEREDIISLLEDSNLRGLGGAGFPTGRKWRILSEQPNPKMVAINIDEGEPGTFKDRVYLEQDPHRFIEGTLIAHWATDADKIYIYLRDEYAGCRKALEKELELLETRSPPCELPEIHLRRGAGAYICGEESAMIESIEGKRGMPRGYDRLMLHRSAYLAALPSNKTWKVCTGSVTSLSNGPEWFSNNGRHDRKGLRSFSVSGPRAKAWCSLSPLLASPCRN